MNGSNEIFSLSGELNGSRAQTPNTRLRYEFRRRNEFSSSKFVFQFDRIALRRTLTFGTSVYVLMRWGKTVNIAVCSGANAHTALSSVGVHTSTD